MKKLKKGSVVRLLKDDEVIKTKVKKVLSVHGITVYPLMTKNVITDVISHSALTERIKNETAYLGNPKILRKFETK